MTWHIEGSNQEIFDKTVQHLAQQKYKSVDGDRNFCMYRGEPSRKCAFGIHIPDEVYRTRMECESARRLRDIHNFTYDADFLLFEMLQNAHDTYNTTESLKQELSTIAAKFHLHPSSINLITKWEGDTR